MTEGNRKVLDMLRDFQSRQDAEPAQWKKLWTASIESCVDSLRAHGCEVDKCPGCGQWVAPDEAGHGKDIGLDTESYPCRRVPVLSLGQGDYRRDYHFGGDLAHALTALAPAYHPKETAAVAGALLADVAGGGA